LIDGDRGCGKTVALQQIVQFARESEWLVLYVPTARAWCFEAPYVIPSPYVEGKYDIDSYGVEVLENFLHCHGEQLRAVPLRGSYGDRYYPESFAAKPKDVSEYDASTLTLRDLVVNGIRDEELACAAVVDLRNELAECTEFPVLVAVDEYNTWFGKTVFGYEGKDVKPGDISVIDALTDLREKGLVPGRKLKNGLFIAAITENFPTRVHFKKQVDYRAHRATMRPYTPEELKTVIAYYNQVHFLHGAFCVRGEGEGAETNTVLMDDRQADGRGTRVLSFDDQGSAAQCLRPRVLLVNHQASESSQGIDREEKTTPSSEAVAMTP
jgi:hypothetical protein